MALARTSRVFLAVLVAYAVFLLSSFGQPRGWIVDERGQPAAIDFAGIWTAGELARKGEAAAAYDWDAHKARQTDLFGHDAGVYYQWPYPPTVLPLASALASLPYPIAFAVGLTLTFLAYSAAAYLVLGTLDGLLAMTATPATFANAYVGQNGFLSAALFGGALAALPARPVLAGCLVGLLAYKPQLGVLIPVALVAAGAWSAIAAAACTLALTVVLSIALYGIEPWHAFFGQIEKVGLLIEEDGIARKCQSLFGLMRSMGLDGGTAYVVNAAAALVLALLVYQIWRREDVAHAIKASCLVSASLLATPYLFIYDLTVLSVAQAYFLAHVIQRGVLPRDVAGLIGVNALVALFFLVTFPFGMLATLLMLCLALSEIARPPPPG